MRRKRLIGWSMILLLLIAAVFAATTSEAYHTVAYVSETTGSTYGYHLWPGGLKTGQWSHTSPMERYLVGHLDGPIENRWSRCSYMGTTVFGDHISFADGPVGGMVHLHDPDMKLWVDHHSRAEIIELYDFLRSADVAASQERADRILEEVAKYK